MQHFFNSSFSQIKVWSYVNHLENLLSRLYFKSIEMNFLLVQSSWINHDILLCFTSLPCLIWLENCFEDLSWREKKTLILLLSPYSSVNFSVLLSFYSCGLLHWMTAYCFFNWVSRQEDVMPETISESDLREFVNNFHFKKVSMNINFGWHILAQG